MLFNCCMYCCCLGITIPESGHIVRAAVLSLHADNEAAQIAAGVTTSSGTQFCRQCDTVKGGMYSFPEYVSFTISYIFQLFVTLN